MERLVHFKGRLLNEEDQPVLEDVDGYYGCHALPGGRKSWYGNFDLTADQHSKLASGVRYRLIMEDGKSGDIYMDIHDSNVPGHETAEFQIVGGLKEKKTLPR